MSKVKKKRLRSGEQNVKRGHKFKDDIYKSLLNGTFPRGHLNTLLKNSETPLSEAMKLFEEEINELSADEVLNNAQWGKCEIYKTN